MGGFADFGRRRMAKRHQLAVLVAVVCLLGAFRLEAQAAIGIVGAPKDVGNFANSAEIDELARFAVDKYKARQVGCREMS
jgi:hypothetical protein